MAAGGNVRISADTYYNKYNSSEPPKDFAVSSTYMERAWEDAYKLKREVENLREQVSARTTKVAEHENLLVRFDQYAARQAAKIAQMEGKLGTVADATVPKRDHYWRVALASGAAALCAFVVGLWSPWSQPVSPAATRSAVSSALTTRTVSVTREPTPSPTTGALASSPMPCSDGSWKVRLAYFPVEASAASQAKHTDLSARIKRLRATPDTASLTSVTDACAGVVADIEASEGWMVWSGPFQSRRDAQTYCGKLLFRTDVYEDCYPLPDSPE